MKFTVRTAEDVSRVVYGILLAGDLYPPPSHTNINTSLAMFMNALRKITREMQKIGGLELLSLGGEQDLCNVFLRRLQGAHSYVIDADYRPIVFTRHEFKGILLVKPRLDVLTDNYQFTVTWNRVDFEIEAHAFSNYQARMVSLLMMNWACLEPEWVARPITLEGHTLSMGMWIAAKLYEAQGDLAGKNATVDEALERGYTGDQAEPGSA